jgi:hypothetical protein
MQIKPLDMFHTPSSWKELQDWIDGHAGPERAVATVAAVMAWNLAATITNQKEEAA